MAESLPLSTAFEWIGSIFSIGYFLTPLYQIIYLYKGRIHVQQIPLVLLIAILLNCLLYDLFGFFRPTKWVSMLITNSIGIISNVVILFLYLYLLCNKEIWKFLGYGLFVVNLLVEIAYLMHQFIIKGSDNDQEGNDLTGLFGMIVNIFMYASPCVNLVMILLLNLL